MSPEKQKLLEVPSFKSEQAYSGRHMFHKPQYSLPSDQAERLFTDRTFEISYDSAVACKESCDLEVILDDIRSSHNVGSIFRTADAAGWSRISLTGITATPASPGVAKTALGAQNWIQYTYHANIIERLHQLRKSQTEIAALELCEGAESLFSIHHIPESFALVIGNEVSGVSPEALSLCHRHIKIPMSGRKGSLNVAVAFGIASFHIANTWRSLYSHT